MKTTEQQRQQYAQQWANRMQAKAEARQEQARRVKKVQEKAAFFAHFNPVIK